MYEWKKQNTERIDILFEKGTKEKINQVRGQKSIAEYVRHAVAVQLEKDISNRT